MSGRQSVGGQSAGGYNGGAGVIGNEHELDDGGFGFDGNNNIGQAPFQQPNIHEEPYVNNQGGNNNQMMMNG